MDLRSAGTLRSADLEQAAHPPAGLQGLPGRTPACKQLQGPDYSGCRTAHSEPSIWAAFSKWGLTLLPRFMEQ